MNLLGLHAVDLNKISIIHFWKTYFWHSKISIKYLIFFNNNFCEGYYIDCGDVDNFVGIIWSTENSTSYNIFFFIYIYFIIIIWDEWHLWLIFSQYRILG